MSNLRLLRSGIQGLVCHRRSESGSSSAWYGLIMVGREMPAAPDSAWRSLAATPEHMAVISPVRIPAGLARCSGLCCRWSREKRLCTRRGQDRGTFNRMSPRPRATRKVPPGGHRPAGGRLVPEPERAQVASDRDPTFLAGKHLVGNGIADEAYGR